MAAQVERIQRDIEALAEFTATPGRGMTRFTFTEEYDKSRKYIVGRMEEVGLAVREDAIGDIIGRLEGREDLPPVMIGSHFDSVKNGGNFDGPAGVVVGLEVARLFRDEGIHPRRPIEFCALVEEEGGRFGGGLFASRGIVGRLRAEDLEGYRDENGVSIGAAMGEYGFDPARFREAVRAPESIHAFLETHIEQGPVLESTGTHLGVVTHIVGLTQFLVEITGRPDHAGTTPMELRADALAAASAVIAKLPGLACRAGCGTVATVGRLQVLPGAANIVPGKVSFTVDIRCREEACVEQVRDAFLRELEAAVAPPLSHRVEVLLYTKPVRMDEGIIAAMKGACERLGYTHRDMTSGAGHDAMVMAEITPAALLFVPSRDGRSHCPEEWTDYIHLKRAANVYHETLRELTK